MALQMDFTDDSGTTHTAAHWRAVQINIGSADHNINLDFYAYRDIQAFVTGKAPLAGGFKRYTITGAEFMLIAQAAPNGTTLYDVLANASDQHAMDKKDVDSGTKDSNGLPIMVSFFANATKV